MQTPMAKRYEYWDHFISYAFVEGKLPHGVTGPRLRKVKAEVIADDDFWWDVVNRHGGLDVTPEQMAERDPAQYEHCQGNFWGMVMQDLVEARLIT